MGRGIDITLGLKDNLSGPLRSATKSASGELDSLQKKMDGMRGPSIKTSGGGDSGGGGGGLGIGGIVTGNLIADALGSIASGILSAGGQLIGAIGSQFREAEEANRGALGATSANAALLGISFKESAKLTKDISRTLAESAKKLPGATKDYLQAFNGVSDTLTLSGGLTKKGLTDAGREMVELTALLGQASGSGSATTSTVLGKMLGDTGSESLFRIDAFEKVPAFKALLERDLEKAGKTLKDFFKMDAKAKQEQLVGVKKQLFSKEYIAEMNLSMGAQLDVLKSKLFDPTSGLFGFMRNVTVEGAETNVLSELGRTFSVLTAAASEVLGSLGGVSFDPMVALIKGLRGMANLLRNPATILPGTIDGLLSGLGTFFTHLATLPGKMVAGLGSMLMGIDGGQVQVIAAQVTQGIVGWVNSIMTSQSGQAGSALEGVFGVLLGGFALIGNVALGVLFGLAQSIPTLLSTIFTGLDVAFQGMGEVAANMFSSLGVAIGEVQIMVLEQIGAFGGAIAGAISGWVSSVQTSFQTLIEGTVSGITGLVANIPNYLSSVGDALMGIGPAIAGFISSKLSSLVGGGGNVPSRYSGQNLHLTHQSAFRGGSKHMNRVMTASNGLFDAAALESARMPSGSSLVIANSSELIIPRNQINRVLSGAGTQVNITINPQTDRIIQDTVTALTNALSRPSVSMV